MRLSILLLMLSSILTAGAQQTILIKISDKENNRGIEANVLFKNSSTGYTSDSLGVVSIPFAANGEYVLNISATDYQPKEVRLKIPRTTDTVLVQLEAVEEELEEVVIQSTRTSRTIVNEPTRVETIDFEEIDEKNNMRPGNVAMLLHESTGIQVQQTSATSANASIRIQGLDGRYTQLLKDGFANFGNFSSGLSVLEIPPLDLKQVEIIKGPASPLFGGGAIAGVVNFISKTPGAEPEYNFILNQSTIGQSNLGGFASGRNKKIGYTILALYNRQRAFDVDKDNFTEVPKSNEYSLHPKLFIYAGQKSTIVIGSSITSGERTGGDLFVINNKADANHQYFEKNKTFRNINTFELNVQINNAKKFVAKQSVGLFKRTINLPGYYFKGFNQNAYTDVSYIFNTGRHAFVFGGNFVYDDFDEEKNSNERDNKTRTLGLYGQHTWDAAEQIKFETGLRFDAVNYNNPVYSNKEVFILPRVSVLIKYNDQWSSRIGGGMGYKTPTLFTEQTETMQYRDIDQLIAVRSEKSYGTTADVNFRTYLSDDLSISFNHMFFYTRVNQPLVLENTAGKYKFVNAAKPVHSSGVETNLKFIYRKNFKLFIGYTLTNAKADYLPGNQFLPLVPKNKLNTALIYEKEDVIKLGLEGYFTGRQYLSNGERTSPYPDLGFMAEKLFDKFSLYINFENFTDTRQSRYKTVVSGSSLNPAFDEIWTHTEGFIINGGIKLKL